MLLPPGPTSKELREAVALLHKETPYNSADGRALSWMDKSPTTHVWVDDGTHLMGSRRVHERAQHPESFHTAEAARLDARPKARWDPEEVHLMAAFE